MAAAAVEVERSLMLLQFGAGWKVNSWTEILWPLLYIVESYGGVWFDVLHSTNASPLPQKARISFEICIENP